MVAINPVRNCMCWAESGSIISPAVSVKTDFSPSTTVWLEPARAAMSALGGRPGVGGGLGPLGRGCLVCGGRRGRLGQKGGLVVGGSQGGDGRGLVGAVDLLLQGRQP